MLATPDITAADSERMKAWLSRVPDTASVAHFVGSAEIQRIGLHFDIAKLREVLDQALALVQFKGDLDNGFGAFSLTRRPGVEIETANDLSGRFYTQGSTIATKKSSGKISSMSLHSPSLSRFSRVRISSTCTGS